MTKHGSRAVAERLSIAFDLGATPSIRTAGELRDRLASELASRPSLVISAAALESIDVSTLQLLASAHRTAAAAGKTMTIEAPAGGVLAQTLVRLGFVSADGEPLAPEGSFWRSQPPKESRAA